MQIVLLGMLMFTILVLSLVIMLMIAKAKLVSSGTVSILINDDADKALTVPVGGSLLGTLANQKIFIPSACGGKGSCGVCKVTVKEGGGALLPTEEAHINRGQARAGLRLSCQVKVKQPLKIELPPEVFDVRKWTCKVRSNHNVATFIKELVLELPPGEEVPFRAGGYIQIECPPHTIHYKDFDIEPQYRDAWDAFKLWDLKSATDETVTRAYSMANYPEEKSIIMLNVRIATPPPRTQGIPPGIMSSYIFSRKPGDEVVISGPFGEFFAKDTDREMCFIGGGAGMAPHAFSHLRPVQAAEDKAESHVLVRRAQPARDVLRRGFRFDPGRKPELQVARGAVGTSAGRQLDRSHGIHPSGAVRQLLEGTPRAGRYRILHLRAAHDAQCVSEHAAQPRRRG